MPPSMLSSSGPDGAAPEILKLLAHDMRWRLMRVLARSDYRVQELVRQVGEPANLVSYHLRQLREGGLVAEHRSAADGRDVYYSLDLDRLRTLYGAAGSLLHPALMSTEGSPQRERIPAPPDELGRPTVRVLFLCTHNSARSQMAEGLLRHLARHSVEVASAGTEPTVVHPLAVRALADLGIDISHQHTKHLDLFRGQTFEYIITLCDVLREICPLFDGAPAYIHWSLPDPAAVKGDEETRFAAFTRTRQDLVSRIRHFLAVLEQEQTHVA